MAFLIKSPLFDKCQNTESAKVVERYLCQRNSGGVATVVCLAIGELKRSYEWPTSILRKSSLRSEFSDHDEENSLPISVALYRG